MPSTGPTPIASDADRPRLAPHVRLTFDPAREQRARYERVDDDEVRVFLDRLAARRCVEVSRG
jgi:pyrroloquinoline quinone biosynthesis protein D